MNLKNFYIVTLVLLGLLGGAEGEATSFANKYMACEDLPKAWQPMMSFYQFRWATDSKKNRIKQPINNAGTIYVEVSKSSNDQTRIKALHILYNDKHKDCRYKVEHEITIDELRYDKNGAPNKNGYVLKEISGRKIMTLIAPDVTDQGGPVKVRLLKEANAIASDDYSSGVAFNVSIEELELPNGKRADTVVLRLPGKGSAPGPQFNILEVDVRMKKFPFKGTIAAGTNRVSYCYENCDSGKLIGYEYVL